jgi:hypothetical protein
MSLKEKIKEDLKLAMKEKRELEVSVLRQLLAVALTREKEKKFKEEGEDVQLTEEEFLAVISSEAKKRRESIESFTKGKRNDLAEKEKEELVILEKYLPEQLPEEEIKKLAEAVITEVGAERVKDVGKVMAGLMPKVKGRADGSLVGRVVNQLLQ